MKTRLVSSFIFSVTALSLGGCSADFVRSETAAYVAAGKNAAEKSKVFYEEVLAADHDYFDATLALESGCGTPEPLALLHEPGKNYYACKAGNEDASCEAARAYAWTLSASKYANRQPADELKSKYPGEGEISLENRLLAVRQCDDYVREARALYGGTPGDIIRKSSAQVDPAALWRVCADLGSARDRCLAGLGHQFAKIRLSPFNGDTFAVEYGVIDALLEYLQALGKLAEDPKSKVEGELETAVTRFDSISTILGGSGTNDEAKKKIGAIGALADEIRSFAKSIRQAGAIRDTLNTQAPSIKRRTLELAGSIDMEVGGLINKLGQQRMKFRGWLEDPANANNPNRWRIVRMAGQHDQALATISRTRQLPSDCADGAVAAAKPALCAVGYAPASRLLRAAMVLQDELVAIANDGKLNAEQRRRKAHLAWQRFSAFASSLAGIVTAFAL